MKKTKKKNKQPIDIVKTPSNTFSLPLQLTVIENFNEIKKNLPKIKVIEVESLKTPGYPVFSFYKPISRIF